MYYDDEDVIEQSDGDAMEEVLKMSLESYSMRREGNANSSRRKLSAVGSSTSRAAASSAMSYNKIRDLEEQNTRDLAEIRELNDTIRKAELARKSLQDAMRERELELDALRQHARGGAVAVAKPRQGTSAPRGASIDYSSPDFEWGAQMKAQMKKVFGINAFRLCQEGVCNANMDSRDIICVMPTGGGKSLTYQLPAIMSRGCTLVVSPLISLMTDQILHLREFGIAAVMITGYTSKTESNDIYRRFDEMARSPIQGQDDIKMCYVTPEKMSKSNVFMSKMQKLADSGRLARIVIDEAHCISQQGHDFRPDYLALNSCRKLWPRVPILALSATCPPAVLKDILKILQLKPIVNGRDASKEGTVYFTSPLYRKNLHYKILTKPSAASQVNKEITRWILEEHPRDTGIIYCFSRKDTEAVAEAVLKESGGKIKTGVYHSEIADGSKLRLHEKWRNGDVQVVCATIAFGLGIDKGNVRFVIHHTLSKSLDGFYQESGRAGRDGEDADCVLYYRPQDGMAVNSQTMSERTPQANLHEMLRFAQDLDQCRKVQFAKYFSASSQLDTASWTTAEEDAMSRCGHCDNCTRSPETVDRRDVTLEAWQILTIAEAVQKERGRVTLGQLADLARGSGKGEFGSASHGKRGKATKSTLDWEAVIGDPVKLSKDHTEWLCVQLLVQGYLKEHWVKNAYTVNTYLQPGDQCYRITRHSQDDVREGNGVRIQCSFIVKASKRSGKQKAADPTTESDKEQDPPPIISGTARRKRKLSHSPKRHAEEEFDYIADSTWRDEDSPAYKRTTGKNKTGSTSSEDDGDDDWSQTLRPRSKTTRKRPRTSTSSKKALATNDVIELSSD